jgi:hypothetical protein
MDLQRGISYSELSQKYGHRDNMHYTQLLLTSEWLAKRLQIIGRDNSRCQKCNAFGTEFDPSGRPYLSDLEEGEIGEQALYDQYGGFIDMFPIWGWKEVRDYTVKACVLHVHHKYYIKTQLPWEYPDDALITLCQSCHSELHKREKVVTYGNVMRSMGEYLTPCFRCNGAGHLPEYSYYKGGICFRCNGVMYDEWIKNHSGNGTL